MIFDLIVKNGTLIDPSTGRNGLYDLLIHDGKIKGIYAKGTCTVQVREEIEAVGCIVSPGLIDLHAHVFEGTIGMGVAPDLVGVAQGVTTVVDAGSSGARYFDEFVQRAVKTSQSQVLAWLNIAGAGLCEGLTELANLEDIDINMTREVIQTYPLIKGIKARMSGSVVKESGIVPLDLAKRLGNELHLPLMVHIGNTPPPLPDILERLSKGDVVTHAFHGKKGGIIGADGQLIPQAKNALDRGVYFDVGHGSSSFSFTTMRKAKELGVAPHTISTDIYSKNMNGPVYSLTVTMTKFLALGYSMEQIITWTTTNPAKILDMDKEIGTLKEETIADVTILRVIDKPLLLSDSEGENLMTPQQILVDKTIKSGKVLSSHD